MFWKVSVIALLGLADAVNQFHFRRSVGEKPRPIEMPSFTNMDLEAFRPPVHLAGFDLINSRAHEIEAAEQARLDKDAAGIKKVEEEFLESNLHKGALAMQLHKEE